MTTGVSSTHALTNNVLVLQEVQRRSKQCDYCDDVVDASHRCIECKSLLCSFHVKAHARSRGTKSHNIFQLRGSNRGIGAAAATGVVRRLPLACPRHAEVPAKLFCSEPCGALMCHDCSVADHSGHKIFLADSEEVEVIHRTGLTRRVIHLGHRYSASYSTAVLRRIRSLWLMWNTEGGFCTCIRIYIAQLYADVIKTHTKPGT